MLAEAAKTLDFDKPVAVMYMGVLGYEPDLAVVRSIVERTMDAMPSGSYLVLWDGTNTSPAVVSGAERLAQSGGVPYILRSPEELESCFDGLTMVQRAWCRSPGGDRSIPTRSGSTPTAPWRASPDRPDAAPPPP
ncbi:SAM-dependent methyltransferase [Micromonospora sp. NPDC049101]|uniref:SAM-dependent methyltransferase n=1 Tax=unclassified Micromonospora TaxID=2617518 RepID=UPI0033C0CFDA